MIPWWASCLIANVLIITIEALNRKLGGSSFWVTLPYTAPLILLAQWALWGAWRHAPHILVAWAMFSACNNLMRLFMAQFVLHEPVSIRRLGLSLCMLLIAYFMKRG